LSAWPMLSRRSGLDSDTAELEKFRSD